MADPKESEPLLRIPRPRFVRGYNPLTLSFTGQGRMLEEIFIKERTESSLNFIRFSLCLGLVVYSVFGILDAVVAPEVRNILWLLRFGVVSPVVLAVIVYSFHESFSRYLPLCLSLCIVLAGVSITGMMALASPPVSHTYYAGLIIVFMWGYAFLRARFIHATITGWTITLTQLFAAPHLEGVTDQILVQQGFFLISANMVGMFITYSLEYYERRSFLLRRRLREDIDGRRRMEQALRRSSEFLQNALDTVDDPFFVKDEEHRWLLLNDSACRAIGRSRQELLGRNDTYIFPPEQVAVFWAHDDEVLATGNTVMKEVEINWGGKGPPRIIANKKSLFVDPVTGQRLVVGTIRDMTQAKRAERERRKLEAQLRQSQKMEAIGTLAGGIAHDFNNILGAVIGFTELAKDKITTAEDPRPELDQVLFASERARDLIRQILIFSRKASVELKPLDLNHEVLKAFRMLRRTLPRMVNFEISLSAEPAMIRGDENQLAQVLMNLASNAADSMPGGGAIFLETRNRASLGANTQGFAEDMEGEYVSVSMRDTGFGMEPEVLKQIFDPFFTTKDVGKGTGLGLSIVFGIVKAHGGFVITESEPGRGSVFTIFLPALTGENLAPKHPVSVADDYPTGYETLLVVDDDLAVGEMIRSSLTRLGYEVLMAVSGEEALELYARNPHAIDLVLLDLDMPGMGGKECLRRLMEQDVRPMVLVVSGHGRQDYVNQTLAMGARDYLAKPFERSRLSRAVRKVLDSGQSKADSSGSFSS